MFNRVSFKKTQFPSYKPRHVPGTFHRQLLFQSSERIFRMHLFHSNNRCEVDLKCMCLLTGASLCKGRVALLRRDLIFCKNVEVYIV